MGCFCGRHRWPVYNVTVALIDCYGLTLQAGRLLDQADVDEDQMLDFEEFFNYLERARSELMAVSAQKANEQASGTL